MLISIIAFTVSLASVGAIYWSWRQGGRATLALAGWMLALASIMIWSRALGPEFGVTYAVIIFMSLVWASVALTTAATNNADQSARPACQRPYRPLAVPDPSSLRKHGAIFLLSVPATGVLAMLLSIALVIYLPWTMLLKVTVAIFLYPVLWGALSAWICATDNPVKPALVVACLFIISSLLLFA